MGSQERVLRRLSARARARRWAEFTRRFPDLASMRVLDLGGTVQSWVRAPARPKHVVILNLDGRNGGEADWYVTRTGDACEPPPDLLQEEFDLVFSNSLLEHVGGHARRKQLADVIRLVAPHHWVQTPYRYFPVEPHWLVPGMQFLPVMAQAAISRRMSFGPANSTMPHERILDECSYVDLIGLTQLRTYFPDSSIWCERAAGLVKSIVAYR